MTGDELYSDFLDSVNTLQIVDLTKRLNECHLTVLLLLDDIS